MFTYRGVKDGQPSRDVVTITDQTATINGYPCAVVRDNLYLNGVLETTLVVGSWTYAGIGWHTTGDALLANTSAALARERRRAAKDALASTA